MSVSDEGNNVVCSKCESRDSDHWERDEDDNILCEHCNEDLIARNLAKEIMQHEMVKREFETGSDSEREDADLDDEDLIEEEMVDEEEEEEEEEDEEGDGEEEEEDYEDEEVMEHEEEEEADTEKPKPGVQIKSRQDEEHDEEEEEEEDDDEDEDGPVVRRSTRSTLNKYKNPDLEPPEPVETSRRAKAFNKRNVYKSPSAQATCVTSNYVFHRGVYYQLGDIVAIMDSLDRGIFYAQITSFLTDQYCNRSATIQWLLPTAESPDNNLAFDPRTYYLGFIEDFPRSLDCMIPVMHAPSDYYRFNDSPYPPVIPPPEIAKYVWHNLERVYIRKIN